MSQVGTKRERLLDWIRSGNPRDVPVLLGPGFEVPASYLGKGEAEVTWAEAVQVAEETGTHNIACVFCPLPEAAVPFIEDIRMGEMWDELPDGTPRLTRKINTPEGVLTDVREFPEGKPAHRRRFFVNGDEDFPAFAYLIRRACESVVKNSALCCRMDEQIKANKEEVRGAFPTEIHLFCPAAGLMSYNYISQELGILAIYDKLELMEELMGCYWRMTDVWLDLAARNDIDIYSYAIHGFEILCPDIYERYMIPQARRINQFAAAHGKLSWVHTCGKLKRIAATGTYQSMKVNVVESLSSPPTGDIDDLAETRRNIGSEIATRGGINVEYFYGRDAEALKSQAERVLDATTDYRHMLGDTNSSCPSYSWENIQAAINVVKHRGRLFQ